MSYKRIEFSVKSRKTPPPRHAVEDTSAMRPEGPKWCEAGRAYRNQCAHCKRIDALVAMDRAADLTDAERIRWLVGPIPGVGRGYDEWWMP